MRRINAPELTNPALVPAGTTQGDATPIIAATPDVYCPTVGANTGVILPAPNAGDAFIIGNGGANALKVYPHVGGSINGLATNAPVSVSANTSVLIYALSQSIFCSI